jgi:hypothetical protein
LTRVTLARPCVPPSTGRVHSASPVARSSSVGEAADRDRPAGVREPILELGRVANGQVGELLGDAGRIVHLGGVGHDRRRRAGVLGLREAGPFDVEGREARRGIDDEQAVAGGGDQGSSVVSHGQTVDRSAQVGHEVGLHRAGAADVDGGEVQREHLAVLRRDVQLARGGVVGERRRGPDLPGRHVVARREVVAA